CAAVTALLLGTLRSLAPAKPAFAPVETRPDEPMAAEHVPPPGPHADRYQRELEAEDDVLHGYILEHPRDADEARMRLIRTLHVIATIRQARREAATEAARRLPDRPPTP